MGERNLSLTYELNPKTVNFNYSKSSVDLTFIESNAKLPLGLRNSGRQFVLSSIYDGI